MRRLLPRKLLVGDTLPLALLLRPFLLGGLAALTLLALLPLALLARGLLARRLLTLDGRLIDDGSLDGRRSCDRHPRSFAAPRDADDDARNDSHVERE